ncbi:MAG: DUF2505 family protein [Kofleriaceae bacterium]
MFAAFFDPTNQLRQDQALAITERTVLDLTDDAATLRRTCKVVPNRKLPRLVRAFFKEPLYYLETAIWRRTANEIDIETRLSMCLDRPVPTVRAVYRLSRLADGSIRRRFEGTVSVDVAVVSSRIERGIIAEYERSLPVAAGVTQAFLDRNVALPSARA